MNTVWFNDTCEDEIIQQQVSTPQSSSYAYMGWSPCMPSPAKEESKKTLSQTRDWNISSVHDEDNIEAFHSLEMMSALFLQNIKNQLWTQK